MRLDILLISLALLTPSLSLPVEPDLPHANIVLPPRAINPMYLDEAREEWGGPEALKQGNGSPSSHSGFGVAPGGYGGGGTVDVPRPTLSPVPGGGKREIQDEDEWSTYHVPVSKRVGDEADHADFIAPRAINPIYANVSHDQVYKRADSGPIYGSSGKPQMTDVHQTTNPSCGFASVLAAVVNVNPAWISSHISFSGDRNSVSTAKVTMYNPENFAPKTFDISCAETAIMSDVDPATGVWWPGAYDHAGVKLGLDNSNGAMGPISPQKSLQAITGFQGLMEFSPTADRIFELAQMAKSKNTPMVLQTKPTGPTVLVDSHAYALLDGTGSGSQRMITVYNPWGSISTVHVDVAAAETYTIARLRDYNTFTGAAGEGGGGQNSPPPTPPPPPPKTTPAPQNKQQQGPPQIKNGGGPAPPPQDGVVWVTEVVTITVGA